MDSPMDPMTLTMVQFEKATRNLKDIPIVSIVILIWLYTIKLVNQKGTTMETVGTVVDNRHRAYRIF